MPTGEEKFAALLQDLQELSTYLHGRVYILPPKIPCKCLFCTKYAFSSSSPSAETWCFRVKRRARFIAATADLSARSRTSPERILLAKCVTENATNTIKGV